MKVLMRFYGLVPFTTETKPLQPQQYPYLVRKICYAGGEAEVVQQC
jgi:hypothetical protein